eukprot:CAMPEP_0198292118 /NCGR_PEP_ID=MMETSP1449-20131203/9890_1 /TAXON_ID=420275 /ORGANISM="Attheya septentrionalis, Strain CCMP2084" /LENGTH=86 /DNA_ID=CAMNT_0043990849 /DNA_START=263 /DNA_END=523 /DNA_ORIENTATION=+
MTAFCWAGVSSSQSLFRTSGHESLSQSSWVNPTDIAASLTFSGTSAELSSLYLVSQDVTSYPSVSAAFHSIGVRSSKDFSSDSGQP